MNHQHFEQWLLFEKPLAPDQAEALKNHLKTCESCRQLSSAWSEVERLFRSAPFLGPVAGFASRWQDRLESQRVKELHIRQQRQSWIIFLVATIGAALLFVLILSQILATFNSPSEVLVYWVGQVTTLLSEANAMQEVGFILFRTIGGVVPDSYWMVLFSTLSVLCVLWILSLQHILFRGGLLNETNH